MGKKGFLLFEAMVAVAVVGIGMAAVLRSISYALATAKASQDYLAASSLLSAKLWEVNSLGSVDPGIREGTCSENSRFRYRVAIEELAPEAAPESALGETQETIAAKLKKNALGMVTVTLAWGPPEKEKKLIAQTYMPIRQEEGLPAPVRYLP